VSGGRAALLLLVLSARCAPAPEDTLQAYARALEEGDADRAWDLLSAGYRQQLSREALRRALREDPGEARRVAAEARAAAPRLRQHARVAYGERGEALELVLEDGRWRLAKDPLSFFSQETPRDALRSFVRAIERRRWDIVLRLVPERWKGGMTAESLGADWEGPRKDEIAALRRALLPHLLDPIEEHGDEARMPYGTSAVQFVREGGVWKILDPD
jgi:hypothetical protein